MAAPPSSRRPTSVGPFRVSEQHATPQALARDINRQLDLVTTQVDAAIGYRGHVNLVNNLDMNGHGIFNVGEGTALTNGATVGQIRELQALLAEARRLLLILQQEITGALKLTAVPPTTIQSGDTPQVGSDRFAAHGDHRHGYTAIYDVGGAIGGKPSASLVIIRYPFPHNVTLPSGLGDSQGVVAIAPTLQADFDLRKNGVSFGTMRFAGAATTATFLAATTTHFAPSDVLTVVAPSPQDATLSDLGFALAGVRS